MGLVFKEGQEEFVWWTVIKPNLNKSRKKFPVKFFLEKSWEALLILTESIYNIFHYIYIFLICCCQLSHKQGLHLVHQTELNCNYVPVCFPYLTHIKTDYPPFKYNYISNCASMKTCLIIVWCLRLSSLKHWTHLKSKNIDFFQSQ